MSKLNNVKIGNPRTTKNGKFISKVSQMFDATYNKENPYTLHNKTWKEVRLLDCYNWDISEPRPYSPVYWH